MLIVVLILIFDQFLKIWIKTHMHLGEEISIFDDWFYISVVILYGQYVEVYLYNQDGTNLSSKGGAIASTHIVTVRPCQGNFRFSLGSGGLSLDKVKITAAALAPEDFYIGIPRAASRTAVGTR